jgi:ketosteroid isomerase-like protein
MKIKLLNSILIAALVACSVSVSAATNESDARAFFNKFVTAQNAHDVSQVRSMLWDSPSVLFFSRGAEVRGTQAVADRFDEYYRGTWNLQPDMTKFQAAIVTEDVVQILVPILFTRGLPNAKPESSTFLISQTWVRNQGEWRIASILPIANTQFSAQTK